MTGDGVNDAPALKQAEAGIAVSTATDVAKAAASIVLTQSGLVGVLRAVETGRRIYQRMLTYTLNKIIKTIEIGVFLSVGVILTGTFVITPLLVVLLLFTNDFVTTSIATDRVSFSPQPDRWDIRTLMLTAGTLAGLVLILSFTVFFVGKDILHLPLRQLQTLVFLMLVFTGQGNVYLVRERNRLWYSMPSRWLFIQFGRRHPCSQPDGHERDSHGRHFLVTRCVVVRHRTGISVGNRRAEGSHLWRLWRAVRRRAPMQSCTTSGWW